MILIRTAFFYFFYTLSGLFFALLAFFLLPSSYQTRYYFLSFWAKLNILSLKKIVGVDCKIEGLKNIPDKNEKVIVLSNHQSSWETLFFQTLFKEQTWLLKRELFWIPFFGWALSSLKPIAIDRSKKIYSIKKLLKDGQQRLNQKIWLIVFPEGTRQDYLLIQKKKIDELAKQIKIGGIKLAADSDCLILLVKHNSGKFWPKKGRFQSGKIKLEIAPAFKSNDLKEIKQKCADFFYR